MTAFGHGKRFVDAKLDDRHYGVLGTSNELTKLSLIVKEVEVEVEVKAEVRVKGVIAIKPREPPPNG
jgi:hypothetical protein